MAGLGSASPQLSARTSPKARRRRTSAAAPATTAPAVQGEYAEESLDSSGDSDDTPEPEAQATVGAETSSAKDGYWKEMTAVEQIAAGTLGWTEAMCVTPMITPPCTGQH